MTRPSQLDPVFRRPLALALVLAVASPAFARQEPGHDHDHAARSRSGPLPDFLRCRGAARLRSRPGAPALVRLRASSRQLPRRRRCRSAVRHRVVGRRDDVLPPAVAAAPPEELAAGREAAERASRIGAGSEREKGFIAAIAAFYADADKVDHGTRARAYRDQMEALTQRFPEDAEARIFFALALLGTAPPTDTTLAQQRRPARSERGARAPAAASRYRPLHDPLVRLPASPTWRCPRRAPTPRSRPPRRTRSTCRRTSSRGSAVAGSIRPTSTRRRRPTRSWREASRRGSVGRAARARLSRVRLSADRSDRAGEEGDGARAARRGRWIRFAAGYAMAAIPARYALESGPGRRRQPPPTEDGAALGAVQLRARVHLSSPAPSAPPVWVTRRRQERGRR